MLDLIIILFIISLVNACYVYWLLHKKKKKTPENVFDRFHPYTYFKCKKCGKRWKRLHQNFEYVLQEIGKCKCGGKMIIEGIYYEKRKTKKEIKWDKLDEEWR